MNPLPPELAAQIAALNPLQLAWLSGYCWSQAGGQAVQPGIGAPAAAAPAPAAPAAEPLRVAVISASQTGNARKVAAELQQRLAAAGVNAVHAAAADYKPKNIAGEQLVLLVTSTQGEGEPPEEALSLYKLLSGKKAPKLSGLKFAVLGLGDSSYPMFCGAGKSFDELLAKLGGERLLERQDCDLEYQAEAAAWLDKIVPLVGSLAAAPAAATGTGNASGSPAPAAPASAYNKANPFPATLLVRQKITGRDSEKDVRHIEIDLSGSGLQYRAGDALGVWFENDPAVVDEILAAVSLKGDEPVNAGGQGKTVREALLHDWEIGLNTPQFVQGYAEISGNPELKQAAADASAYAAANPIAGIVSQYPAALTAEQLAGLLRPLAPRLYSISSAPEEVGEEVHLTVGVLRYEHNGIPRTGAASGFLGERLEEEGSVRVFVEENPRFRLPENPDTPVIMIGAGTGVAPFRAFMQQRAANGDSGKNWLIFGNQHFTQDFLYQTEWQGWAKDGLLNKYDFAWSRDQEEKIYVQHKIREEAAELWQWLQQGAHIYVCGDASRMAKDVEQALLDTIAEQGGLSADDADEYLDNLRQEGRYQRDVY
ncbi:assimilatory sulfite reductase (NADPH) flavoprotein subunit [Neisseria sp. HMSC069H12]|uniref:assimilatory sulfite reductase (NADPH) flavoprotein subunit n=1 Tax=Neisseria sp. HMSC069H12 TaxID=1739376 RepID=UPI0008A433D1|nr:assimilatory sulfite reductase (NADPH) flavoprotein subunit [Neisseria sp. HMSC069H12]OFR71664.1 sulfite reductase subunit alpha [Neisseria sp. HMSC069H12]